MTSDLLFEELGVPRKRRLREMALSRRQREAQMFAYRKKMPDLVHFHASFRSKVSRYYFVWSTKTGDHLSSVPDSLRSLLRSSISSAGRSCGRSHRTASKQRIAPKKSRLRNCSKPSS